MRVGFERPAPDGANTTGSPELASTTSMVAALEEDIVLGRLHPRERLIEEELIGRFRVTRHQARQALVELDRMGLVERIPNRGAQVRSYSVEEVEQLYALRALLEGEAARLIDLPVAEGDLAELKALQAVHDQAVKESDLPGIFRANIAFHRKLFSFCRNVFLAEAINAAAQRAHGIRFLVLVGQAEREAARREHHAIIAALTTGDSDLLVKLCRDHLPAAKNAYLRAFG